MKLKKIVGTVLTGALLMTSGITAFAQIPEQTFIVGNQAISNDFVESDIGEGANAFIKKISENNIKGDLRFILSDRNPDMVFNVELNRMESASVLPEITYYGVKKASLNEIPAETFIIGKNAYTNELIDTKTGADAMFKIIDASNNNVEHDVFFKSNAGIIIDVGTEGIYDSSKLDKNGYTLYYTTKYEAGNGKEIH